MNGWLKEAVVCYEGEMWVLKSDFVMRAAPMVLERRRNDVQNGYMLAVVYRS